MSETLAKEQMKNKPKLEDILASRASMETEAKQAAFAFLNYCNAKNITYKWSSTNRWNLKAKSKSLGYIGIGVRERDDNSWNILLNHREIVQYEDFIQKEGLTEIVYNNLNYCEGCNGNSGCMSCTGKLRFENPDSEMLESVKKILDFGLALSHGTASRPIFDPVTNGLTRIDNKLRVSGITDLHGSFNANIDNLFNNKYNNYFYAGPYELYMSKGESHNILFQLNEPVELQMYGLVTGLRHDVPDSWSLYGAESKDGSWTLLDARDKFPKPVTLYTEKAFRINAPKAYQYYRITLESWQFVISQIHLYIK
jgi:hypothetical protein